MADQGALKQIIQKVKDSSNILVTVSTNPSVDELSAALGVTLVINKLNKHATAVFSGEVPSAIEFLKPEQTFESTVDSLRDFIIALDKEKADHLRYKVVDDMVKIFITPYRTTINENDLEFSQGDYNVEFVLAIGVKDEADLDHALESHGRILHDATVAAVSIGEATNLGGIEWSDRNASSYSEMIYQIADGLRGDSSLLDEQIANAFLTGIVASTERFSNNKTSSKVMTIAAQLMSAGANQQLVATKLEEYEQTAEPLPEPEPPRPAKAPRNERAKKEKEAPKDAVAADGSLLISHVPQGTVDEVAKEVAAEKSQQALDHAEDQLARHTQKYNADRQEEAAKEAEDELARHVDQTLPKVAPALPPMPAEPSRDTPETAEEKLAAQLAAVAPKEPKLFDTPVPHPLGSAEPEPIVRQPDMMGEPTMGGTLNATTEQAAEDSRRAIEADRNRTILSHGGTYTASAPSFQSPLNASIGGVDTEPTVPDVLSQINNDAPTGRAEAIQPLAPEPSLPPVQPDPQPVIEEIQPPAPVAAAPTLAEIDAQNRVAHDDARNAIDAAFSSIPETQPAPIQEPQQPMAPQMDASSLPPLPPMPPLPDFSTLPPLPGDASLAPVPMPDTLGEVLPPAPEQAAPQPVDPAQFRIPGQN